MSMTQTWHKHDMNMTYAWHEHDITVTWTWYNVIWTAYKMIHDMYIHDEHMMTWWITLQSKCPLKYIQMCTSFYKLYDLNHMIIIGYSHDDYMYSHNHDTCTTACTYHMMIQSHDYTCTITWWSQDDTCTTAWWHMYKHMMTHVQLHVQSRTIAGWHMYNYMMTHVQTHDDTCTIAGWHMYNYMITHVHHMMLMEACCRYSHAILSCHSHSESYLYTCIKAMKIKECYYSNLMCLFVFHDKINQCHWHNMQS